MRPWERGIMPGHGKRREGSRGEVPWRPIVILGCSGLAGGVSSTDRALGPAVWGRRVARLPASGVLLVATDLQGNLRDYETLKRIHQRELAAGADAILAFTGDLVHGPCPELNEPDAWPSYLGTPYRDESAALIRDFERYTRTERAFSLIGNHEHAHVGGPVVPKFHDDEAAVLDAALGEDRPAIHELFRSFPLLAVSPSGVVLTHGAPRAAEADLEAFEGLGYAGYERISIQRMHQVDTVGALLWARGAAPENARALLAATALEGRPNSFVVYGHDVVREGYDKIEDEQICVSTSFALHDSRKVYLRLDLSTRYRGVRELRDGIEILPLYP